MIVLFPLIINVNSNVFPCMCALIIPAVPATKLPHLEICVFG